MYPYTEIQKTQYRKKTANAFVYLGITLPYFLMLYAPLRKVTIYVSSLNQQ